MAEDRVAMQVPATAPSVPLIRLAAAELAAQSGFGYDRIEDVRIATGEAIRILCPHPRPDGESGSHATPRLDAQFTRTDRSLTVGIRIAGGLFGETISDDAARILDATATTYDITTEAQKSAMITVHFAAEPTP